MRVETRQLSKEGLSVSKQAHILAIEIPDPDFTGFRETDPIAYLAEGTIWIGPRPHLETLDPTHGEHPHRNSILQFIPYVVVRHRGDILAYIRPTHGNEGRLHGKVSVGVGGHVDLADVVHEDSVVDLDATLRQSCAREIMEEIGHHVEPSAITWDGLIVRRDTDVDRVHLGVVAHIDLTDNEKAGLRPNPEIGEVRFMDASTFAAEMAEYDIEPWSRAVLHID